MSSFELLRGADGIGDILALVIMLETGDIKRFKGPGNYASYAAVSIAGVRATENAKVKATERTTTNISC